MRLKNMILGEFHFLWKYGIVVLYGVFTIIYLCLMTAIPEFVRQTTVAILIFTDPTAMGLFFMGAVVLLEKNQRVESSFGVSPIKISEYIIAKITPIMTVGCVVAIILSLYANMFSLLTIVGVTFSSILFSLCGLSVAANIKSLNGFMVATIPFEVVLYLPPILYLFGVINSKLWFIHPGVAAISLIMGKSELCYIAILGVIVWIPPAFLICKKIVKKSFASMGGAKL